MGGSISDAVSSVGSALSSVASVGDSITGATLDPFGLGYGSNITSTLNQFDQYAPAAAALGAAYFTGGASLAALGTDAAATGVDAALATGTDAALASDASLASLTGYDTSLGLGFSGDTAAAFGNLGALSASDPAAYFSGASLDGLNPAAYFTGASNPGSFLDSAGNLYNSAGKLLGQVAKQGLQAYNAYQTQQSGKALSNAYGTQNSALQQQLAQEQRLTNPFAPARAQYLPQTEAAVQNYNTAVQAGPPSVKGSDVFSSPGYQFGIQQGLQGLQRQSAASGHLGSGNELIAANNYAQQYAQQQFQGYSQQMDQQYQNRLNQLQTNAGFLANLSGANFTPNAVALPGASQAVNQQVAQQTATSSALGQLAGLLGGWLG